MSEWSLVIVGPILFALIFIFCYFIFLKEHIKGKKVLFFVEFILIWIANGMLMAYFLDKTHIFVGLATNAEVWFIFLFSFYFIALLLKPFFTWFTSKVKCRKILIYFGYATTLITLIILFFGKQNSLSFFVVEGVFFGLSISTLTLYYLFLNEQYYYRVNSVGVGFVLTVFLALSSFVGSYFYSISSINSISFKYLIIISFSITVIAGILHFLKKENRNFVGYFDGISIKDEQYNTGKTITLLVILTICVSFVSSFFNGIFEKLFVTFYMKNEGLSNDTIKNILNLRGMIPYFLMTTLGYLFFNYLFKKMGYKYFLLTNLFLLFGIYAIDAFTNNGYLVLVLNIFSTFFTTQVMYTLFSVGIFKNYQTKNIPITGFIASGMQCGILLDSLFENLLIKYGANAVFNKYSSINKILNNFNKEDYVSGFKEYNTILTSFSCAASCIILIIILIVYFKHLSLFGVFNNYKNATLSQQEDLKHYLLEKSKTQVILK